MKKFIKKLSTPDLLNRIQNRFYIKIGLFKLTEIIVPIKKRSLDPRYKIVKIDIEHIELLKEYALLHRNQFHYNDNIVFRLTDQDRFAGFAVIDSDCNQIVYLSWIDFKNIQIKEVNFIQNLDETEAYFLDDHCVLEHQRKGIHNSVFIERLKFCNNKGIKSVHIVVYLNNFRALRNLMTFNFKHYKTIVHYPLLKLLRKNEYHDKL